MGGFGGLCAFDGTVARLRYTFAAELTAHELNQFRAAVHFRKLAVAALNQPFVNLERGRTFLRRKHTGSRLVRTRVTRANGAIEFYMRQRSTGSFRLQPSAIGERHDIDAARRHNMLGEIVHMAMTHEIDASARLGARQCNHIQNALAACRASISDLDMPQAAKEP